MEIFRFLIECNKNIYLELITVKLNEYFIDGVAAFHNIP